MTTLHLEAHEWDSAASAAEHRIGGAAYRHLIRARRLALGEAVRLTDGLGQARWSELARADRREGVLRLLGPAPTREPNRWVEVLVAMPKPERAAWLVEKTAELGVRRLRFVACARAPRSPGAAALARWRRIARAALEQSEGSFLMELPAPTAWGAALGLPRLDCEVVLDPAGAARAPGLDTPGAARLWVGPEGGWTVEELEAIRARGAASLNLGPRILRVETAAIVAAARALAAVGEGSHE
jgi:16S rRNA (uracil1498-N3)-methyltransferase